MAMITGKSLTEEQQLGAAIAIGGVFLYSVIDELFAGKGRSAPDADDDKLKKQ